MSETFEHGFVWKLKVEMCSYSSQCLTVIYVEAVPIFQLIFHSSSSWSVRKKSDSICQPLSPTCC